MPSFDLDRFDEMLAGGAASFSPRLVRTQADFICSRQMPDGGFAGHQGGADLYFTDFAVRSLLLLNAESAVLQRVAEHLESIARPPRDLIECFDRLNLARILKRRGVGPVPDAEACRRTMKTQELPGGGFARPGQPIISAYHTFLAALCNQMLGNPIAGSAGIVNSLKCRDGGYGESPGQPASQTTATAAVILLLQMGSPPGAEDMRAAARFLVRRQAPDGGLRAHAEAPWSDLLATFVALTALVTLGDWSGLDLAGIARFVKQAAAPGGGFRAGPMDDIPDVEYTYYGIATLALLNRLAGDAHP